MANSRISNSIRKLRFNHGEMTQQQLAEKVGVTRQTIIAMEQEKYSPSLELAFRIALVFKVPLEEVFSSNLRMGRLTSTFEAPKVKKNL
jgi:putative transcriptional regulator